MTANGTSVSRQNVQARARYWFVYLIRGVLVVVLGLTPLQVSRAQDAATVSLPRSSPEAQGMSSEAIRAFVEAADKEITTMHSFMLVRHGHVVAEGWWKPQTPETPHAMYSLSKSFLSTAVGLAIAERKLSLDDEVLTFFPNLAPPEPSKNLKAMRVRDLLTMSTGHETAPKFTKDVPGRTHQTPPELLTHA